MTDTANPSVPEQGKLRRALAGFGAVMKAMDYASFDSTLDRIERLEREVGRLREDVRHIRDPAAINVQASDADVHEH
jgi:hypothetical protein